MRQHLAVMHFDDMEGYILEPDNARLVPRPFAGSVAAQAPAPMPAPVPALAATMGRGRGRVTGPPGWLSGMDFPPLPAPAPAAVVRTPMPYVSAAQVLADPMAPPVYGAGVLGADGLAVLDGTCRAHVACGCDVP
jgi:hypothetical protein